MIGSLFSGLSGIRSYQTQLEITGNNISNTNTIGFKAGRATFNDIFSKTLRGAKSSAQNKGGINPQQSGRGVKLGSIDTIFTQGSLQSTNKNTDLAIVGNGFFVLSDGANQYFTRAGAFDVSPDGNLIGSNGMIVQGKKAVNGVIAPEAPLENIHLPIDGKLPAKATTKVTLKGNLDARLSAKTKIHTAADAFTKAVAADTELNKLLQVRSPLDAGDKILISGAKSDGTEVLAEYTYADGDTLQNLLDAVETAFDGDITAEIVDGRIFIKDTNAGESKTSIDLSFVDEGTKSSIALPSFIRTIEGAPGAKQVYTAAIPFTAVAELNTDINELSEVTEALDDGDKIHITGIAKDGEPVSATYTYASGDTVENLLDAINTAFDGTTAAASLIDGKIVLKDAVPGISQITINLSFVDQDSNSSIKLPSFNTTEGTNAQIVDTTFNVFDSAGNTHAVTITFRPNGENNWSWEASINTVDATVISGGSGTATFNPDGSLSSFSYDGNLKTFTFEPSNGADKVSISLNFGNLGKFDGITNLPSDSTIIAPEQDGYAAGTLESFNIDDAGLIHGVFSNGITQVLAQLTLANVSNPTGLMKIGEGLFQASANSGQAHLGQPGTEGLGQISSGSLELSNVILAEEFTNMILAQRGFQANANVITTTDTILGDTINLKRG